MIQKNDFVYGFESLNRGSKSNDANWMHSVVPMNKSLRSWRNQENQFYQRTLLPVFKQLHPGYMISNKGYIMDGESQEPSDGSIEESYVNRLRRVSATVWCEHGAQTLTNAIIRKPKTNSTIKKGFAIKSLVFPHASTMSFARPMAQHARSTKKAAPQHTVLLPRLSATETCLDDDPDGATVYSAVSVEKDTHSNTNTIQKTFGSSSNTPVRPTSVQSFAASSHYSHPCFHSSSPSKNSIFSKHYNEGTDNTSSPQHPIYTHLHASSDTSVNEYPYSSEPARKLYIVNLTKKDILSDDET